jgi:hypothetical protein
MVCLSIIQTKIGDRLGKRGFPGALYIADNACADCEISPGKWIRLIYG